MVLLHYVIEVKKMDLQQLEYLVAIAREGTISKAAEKMHISQPALSRSIQRLEDDLGFSLFDRTKNKVFLNQDGLMVVEYAKRVLNEVHIMEKEIDNYRKNKENITIGSCAPAPLWGLQYLLKEQYPLRKQEVILSQDTEMLLEKFLNHELSLIVMDYEIKAKNIETFALFKETLYIAVNKDDPLATLKEITFEQLNGQNILSLAKVGYWSEICHDFLPDSTILYQEDLNTYRALQKVTSLAIFRTNITILKYQNIEDRVYIPIIDPEASLTFYASYHKNNDETYASLKEKITSIPWHKYQYNEPF